MGGDLRNVGTADIVIGSYEDLNSNMSVLVRIVLKSKAAIPHGQTKQTNM